MVSNLIHFIIVSLYTENHRIFRRVFWKILIIQTVVTRKDLWLVLAKIIRLSQLAERATIKGELSNKYDAAMLMRNSGKRSLSAQ
jgi:hypothetical protein